MTTVLFVLGDVFFVAVIFLAASRLFKKLFRRNFTLKGELLVLAGFAVVEVYIWQVAVHKGGAVQWQHVFYLTIPALALAAVLKWWIEDAEE